MGLISVQFYWMTHALWRLTAALQTHTDTHTLSLPFSLCICVCVRGLEMRAAQGTPFITGWLKKASVLGYVPNGTLYPIVHYCWSGCYLGHPLSLLSSIKTQWDIIRQSVVNAGPGAMDTYPLPTTELSWADLSLAEPSWAELTWA